MEKVESNPRISEVDGYDSPGVSVLEKYRGTFEDVKDMSVLGKKQVLRLGALQWKLFEADMSERNFGFVTMVGFASTAMGSWEALLPLYTFVLIDGGLAFLFWGFLAVALGQTLVYASIAEMASMAPTAGGQYHWVSEFAPAKSQKILSYFTGWLTATGWQVYLAGSAFMTGTIIQSAIAFNVEGYEWHAWHGTLLTMAILLFSVVFNTSLAVRLPHIEACLLVIHVAGFLAIIIPLWATAQLGSPKDVLFTFSNNGGWPSMGLSAMIGLSAPLGSIIGYDCSVHMSEELRDASRVMPKALMWSCCVNFIMTFILGVTLIFSTGDVQVILSTPLGQPFLQVFYNATLSVSGTNAMVAIVIILLGGCTISEVAACSRQIWSFSRDGGLPGSKFLSTVNPGWSIPLRAVCVCIFITTLLSCINLGSTAALNAISSLGGVSILTSYYISISCVVYRRLKGPPLPERRWSLGKYGLAVNIASLVFLTPLWFFSWWPLSKPVTAINMNWSSTMFAGVIIIATAFYLVKARHGQYKGPVVDFKRD